MEAPSPALRRRLCSGVGGGGGGELKHIFTKIPSEHHIENRCRIGAGSPSVNTCFLISWPLIIPYLQGLTSHVLSHSLHQAGPVSARGSSALCPAPGGPRWERRGQHPACPGAWRLCPQSPADLLPSGVHPRLPCGLTGAEPSGPGHPLVSHHQLFYCLDNKPCHTRR